MCEGGHLIKVFWENYSKSEYDDENTERNDETKEESETKKVDNET